MKMRKYKRMLNNRRKAYVGFPWIWYQDLTLDQRVALIGSGLFGKNWVHKVVCNTIKQG